MTLEIDCNVAAAKAASFCAEAVVTLRLAQELPQLASETLRTIRAQSLAHCLHSLASNSHFFNGPSVEHLRAYVVDWQASDDMCRSSDGLADFCAELNALRNQVDAALGEYENVMNYGSHRYSDERAGSGSGP